MSLVGLANTRISIDYAQKFSRSLGVTCFVFHVLHMNPLIRFTQRIMCCISKSTMKNRHKSDWDRSSLDVVMVVESV